jgi:hypothetical protein
MYKHYIDFEKPYFTTSISGGNPAAVCLLEEDLPDSTKQKLAMEMNLSETAFVIPGIDLTKRHFGRKVFGQNSWLYWLQKQ